MRCGSLISGWRTSRRTWRGQYIDPRAARITFQQYAERWVATQSADPNTQASMESQLRLRAFPYLDSRPLGFFQPAHIHDRVRQLEDYSNVRTASVRLWRTGTFPGTPLCSSVRPSADRRQQAQRALDA